MNDFQWILNFIFRVEILVVFPGLVLFIVGIFFKIHSCRIRIIWAMSFSLLWCQAVGLLLTLSYRLFAMCKCKRNIWKWYFSRMHCCHRYFVWECLFGIARRCLLGWVRVVDSSASLRKKRCEWQNLEMPMKNSNSKVGFLREPIAG